MAEMTAGSQPQRIGRYEIQKAVGRGMMGVVYQARDAVLGRVLALKTISLAFAVSDKDRQTFEQRFLTEARAAATLSHPCIVVVYDVGTDPETSTLFMALEYLRGKTLESILAEKQVLDWRESLHTAARLADALQHAHAHGVIHRDIKPANVMVLASGEPKLMDFGVAKLDAAQLTTGGQVLGSPSYMSPEQALGEKVDARTDVFSLGAVLYELLTNKKAFPGANLPDILMKLTYEDPAPPSRVVAGLPPAVDLVLANALGKTPAARYADAKAFRDDIEDVLDGRAPRNASIGAPAASPSTFIAKPGAMAPTEPAPKEGVGERTAVAGVSSKALAFPSGKRVSLAILDGGRKGDVVNLPRPKVLIGRVGGHSQADIEIPDPQASRAHAVVECYGSRVVLRDLKSTNGTFIGAERVTEAELENQGEFRVGNTRFVLIFSDQE